MPGIVIDHRAAGSWAAVVGRTAAEIERRGLHAADAVVLLPYAQLMEQARRAWIALELERGRPAGLMPRFETTQNWARSLGPFVPEGADLRQDMAWDLLAARSQLLQTELRERADSLALPLTEAAWSLARRAAAIPAGERMAWAQAGMSATDLTDPMSLLYQDAWLARLALRWAAGSRYPTDRLFDVRAPLLVVVDGLQADPLAHALLARPGQDGLALAFDDRAPEGELACHAARDAEDEAERATACVLRNAGLGRVPVALVAQDRFVVRRVRAMLANRGVSVRDETGWNLATTRSAAAVVALAQAMRQDASADELLDGLKHASALDAAALDRLEALMRGQGLRDARALPPDAPLVGQVAAWREGFTRERALVAWLAALHGLLQAAGLWPALCSDAAGQAVIEATGLDGLDRIGLAGRPERLGFPAFLAWLRQVLEAGSFVPPHPPQADVVILPLAQILGRAPAAVVFPGADEFSFESAMQPPGPWSSAQRRALGLADRPALHAQMQAAWKAVLRVPHVDVLWRTSQNGEVVQAAAMVRACIAADRAQAADPRLPRPLPFRGQPRPRARASEVARARVSASAYAALRQCPYRFFAEHLLRLTEPEELDAGLDKRDFGQWLHAVLAAFHQALAESASAPGGDRVALADAAAVRVTAQSALDAADFLPYRAAWPKVRDAYLNWLAAHEAAGHRFDLAEHAAEHRVGNWTLHGRIDRVDRDAHGEAVLIDYKTESARRSAERVAEGSEDVQLAFYAALLPQPPGAALYLSVEERKTRAAAHPDIARAREQLLHALPLDLDRVATGVPLRALGVGKTCEHCGARGLCRKDGWNLAADEGAPDG